MLYTFACLPDWEELSWNRAGTRKLIRVTYIMRMEESEIVEWVAVTTYNRIWVWDWPYYVAAWVYCLRRSVECRNSATSSSTSPTSFLLRSCGGVGGVASWALANCPRSLHLVPSVVSPWSAGLSALPHFDVDLILSPLLLRPPPSLMVYYYPVENLNSSLSSFFAWGPVL